MNLLSIEEAWGKIRALAQPLPTVVRRLEEAEGFVLAEQVRAPIDLPPFDNSAMDGYALRAEDTVAASADQPVSLSVVGEVRAGRWRSEPIAPGTAVNIMTGAPLPAGADAVLMLESGRLRDGHVEIRESVPRGKHVRQRGEDVRHHDVLLEAGMRLNAQRLGLLSGNGIVRVRVHRRPVVSLIATGSELVEPGHPLGPGQIYDSNRIVLRSLLAPTGSEWHDLGVVPDDRAVIAQRLRAALRADVTLISGGVSVGAHDHVKDVLRELGVETVFWRVNMKPGKPLFCGRLGERWVFGLPGNPISCVVGFLVFIEPLIRILRGERSAALRTHPARLTRAVRKQDERTVFLTAQVEVASDGMLQATPTEQQGSAMMQALAQANAFVMVPAQRMTMEAGERVEVLLLDA